MANDLDQAITNINTAADRTNAMTNFANSVYDGDDSAVLTNPLTGNQVPSVQKQVKDIIAPITPVTADEVRQSQDKMMGYTFKGNYLPDPVTLTNEGDYVLDDDGNRWFGFSLPYQTDPSAHPDPSSDDGLIAGGGYATKNQIMNSVNGVNVLTIGVTKSSPPVSISESITKSAEIISKINDYVAENGPETFVIPPSVIFDGQSLFDNIPHGSYVVGNTEDNGYSYTGYKTKGFFVAGGDTQDDDSMQRVQSGHHAVLSLFNSQLDNTGIGGVGQSESSKEGKCSLTAAAGYQTVNERQVPNPSSRLQFYIINSIRHWGLQHYNAGGSTNTLFDFDSNGNASFGGESSKPEYNFLLYPDNTYTPAADKRTTLAMRNTQPSGNGIRLEMVGRDADGTTCATLDYNGGVLSLQANDSLQGSYTGELSDVITSADISAGRETVSADAARIKSYTDENKSLFLGKNTLTTGLTASLFFMSSSSATKAFNYINVSDTDAGTNPFRVSGAGDVYANSYSPFTGCHLFFSKIELPIGCPVDIVDFSKHNFITWGDNGEEGGLQLNGTVAPSGKLSKICAGLVHSNTQMEGGYMIHVAAVGDNTSGDLQGFNVNDEGGVIEAGDILCTSSEVGKLMKIPEGQPESIVRFKCLQKPTDGKCYGYFR